MFGDKLDNSDEALKSIGKFEILNEFDLVYFDGGLRSNYLKLSKDIKRLLYSKGRADEERKFTVYSNVSKIGTEVTWKNIKEMNVGPY